MLFEQFNKCGSRSQDITMPKYFPSKGGLSCKAQITAKCEHRFSSGELSGGHYHGAEYEGESTGIVLIF